MCQYFFLFLRLSSDWFCLPANSRSFIRKHWSTTDSPSESVVSRCSLIESTGQRLKFIRDRFKLSAFRISIIQRFCSISIFFYSALLLLWICVSKSRFSFLLFLSKEMDLRFLDRPRTKEQHECNFILFFFFIFFSLLLSLLLCLFFFFLPV